MNSDVVSNVINVCIAIFMAVVTAFSVIHVISSMVDFISDAWKETTLSAVSRMQGFFKKKGKTING